MFIKNIKQNENIFLMILRFIQEFIHIKIYEFIHFSRNKSLFIIFNQIFYSNQISFLKHEIKQQ